MRISFMFILLCYVCVVNDSLKIRAWREFAKLSSIDYYNYYFRPVAIRAKALFSWKNRKVWGQKF